MTIWRLILVLSSQDTGLKSLKKRRFSTAWWAIGIGAALILVVAIILSSIFIWYKSSLQPVSPKTTHKIRIQIGEGETTAVIAKKLQKEGIIKNATAFEWYLKLERPQITLQAGRYAISPTLSTPEIVKHLAGGKTDLFMITIVPGSTLKDIEKTLREYGYSESEISTAFEAKYTQPLLADRPQGADLEGYIFPETFEVQSDNSLQDLFNRDFKTLYDRLQKDGLIEQFKKRGLNLHQALTMASIIQKEASGAEDQQKIAQVFYKRLGMGMKLETDPTFMYAAKKLGVEARVNIDSPYNTRLYPGLPPGPIGNMNYSALQAVANPASTEFLYFVAGDDGTNYFSYTLEEHESNVRKYCHKLCQ